MKVVDDRGAEAARSGQRLVLVGVPVDEQLLDRRGVRIPAFGLLRVGALVPLELEPAEGVEDLLDVLRRGAL